MPTVFMTDPGTGHCALYDEASGGGAFDDVNALRNRPLKDPANWLSLIYFHSALDNLEVHSDTTVTVNHEAVSAGDSIDFIGAGSQVRWNAYSRTRTLVTHNLGYTPDYLIARGNNILWPGMPVQSQSGGRARYCTSFANDTQIRLYEWASTSGSALASASLQYRVIIFRNPPAPSGNITFDADGSTGRVLMGRGRFDSLRKYLQVVPGGSPLGIFYGKSIDVSNGAPCFARPDGSTYKPVPTAAHGSFTPPGTNGDSWAYDGSFTGSTAIQVQAP